MRCVAIPGDGRVEILMGIQSENNFIIDRDLLSGGET